MTAPRWGHKPLPVADVETYWSRPAPEPSERMAYWVRRYRMGEWEPNRWLRREGYYGRAVMLGVWLWEGNGPVLALMALAEGLVSEETIVERMAAYGALDGYWTLLEERSRHGVRDPDQPWRDDRFGLLVDELEAHRG